jgi:RNA polymerase sigma-70 factor (sigma-E family)
MDPAAEQEFREFAAARSPALFRVAYLLTGHREQAEDLLQTALARVALRWRRIRGAPEPYARRVIYHEQVNRWRLRSWGRELATGRLPERADPNDRVGDVDLRMALAEALRLLPARQRAVIVLRYYEDLPEREVAALLDVTVGTVRAHASRGLVRLRASCPELLDPPEGPPTAGGSSASTTTRPREEAR